MGFGVSHRLSFVHRKGVDRRFLTRRDALVDASDSCLVSALASDVSCSSAPTLLLITSRFRKAPRFSSYWSVHLLCFALSFPLSLVLLNLSFSVNPHISEKINVNMLQEQLVKGERWCKHQRAQAFHKVAQKWRPFAPKDHMWPAIQRIQRIQTPE